MMIICVQCSALGLTSSSPDIINEHNQNATNRKLGDDFIRLIMQPTPKALVQQNNKSLPKLPIIEVKHAAIAKDPLAQLSYPKDKKNNHSSPSLIHSNMEKSKTTQNSDVSHHRSLQSPQIQESQEKTTPILGNLQPQNTATSQKIMTPKPTNKTINQASTMASSHQDLKHILQPHQSNQSFSKKFKSWLDRSIFWKHSTNVSLLEQKQIPQSRYQEASNTLNVKIAHHGTALPTIVIVMLAIVLCLLSILQGETTLICSSENSAIDHHNRSSQVNTENSSYAMEQKTSMLSQTKARDHSTSDQPPCHQDSTSSPDHKNLKDDTSDTCDSDTCDYDFMGSSEGIPAQLDLAQAYIRMNQIDKADMLLQEILQIGNTEQRKQAKSILLTLTHDT